MPKLVAIGDSLTQGVQSGAVFSPDFSYPVRIARAMGLDVSEDFRTPRIPGHGLPLNIEWLLRSMRETLGESIDLQEWLVNVPFSLARHLDEIEDYYERGLGSRPVRYSGIYHNLAVAGFRVYDSFTVDSNYCRSQIDNTEGWIKDDFLGLPAASTYRIARRVLNPHLIPNRGTWTQIDNLRYFKENRDPVENLILFLGANDCLGTVRDLKIKEMPSRNRYKDPEKRRDRYNLTSLSVFKKDYRHMMGLISAAISPKTKVFVGTIPHVTIAPITQGLGEPIKQKSGEKNGGNKQYFENYGPFFATEKNFRTEFGRTLSCRDVQRIDKRIDDFNDIIIDEVEERDNWYIVDICKLLDSLAIRRKKNLKENSVEGQAREVLEQFFDDKNVSNHPLLCGDLNPTPSVLRLDSCSTNRGKDGDHTHRTAGGFFSLDCFHPTTIGYGLIAEAFLDKMKEAEVPEVHENERLPWQQLDWRTLIQQDTLVKNPPALWDDIIDAAIAHPHLADIICRILL